jgi:hypothetical protein
LKTSLLDKQSQETPAITILFEFFALETGNPLLITAMVTRSPPLFYYCTSINARLEKINLRLDKWALYL